MPSNDWLAKAEFMKGANATHATWAEDGALTSLTLGPQPPTRLGPAAQLQKAHEERMAKQQAEAAQKRHDTLFAASRIRPAFESPIPPPSAVPRAIRAKEAARRGSAG